MLILCVLLVGNIDSTNAQWPHGLRSLVENAYEKLNLYKSGIGDGVGNVSLLRASLTQFETIRSRYGNFLSLDDLAFLDDDQSWGYRKLGEDAKALPLLQSLISTTCRGNRGCISTSVNHAVLVLRRLRRDADAEQLFQTTKRQGHHNWRSSWQMPEFFNASLRAQPYWPAEDFAAAVAMRERASEILAELDALLANQTAPFQLEGDHELVDTRHGWTEFKLMERGRWDAQRCRVFRAACEALRQKREVVGRMPGRQEWGPGQVTIFRLAPGARLKPHTGPTNMRLTAHLALKVPEPAAALTVGDPTRNGARREWREGTVIVFDDSYVHEAHNPSNQPRYVLYASMWHPDLATPLLASTQGSAKEEV